MFHVVSSLGRSRCAQCNKRGISNLILGKLGIPTERMRAIVPTINQFRAICRGRNIPVFFTRMAYNADYSDSGILLESPPASYVKDVCGFIRDTWDSEVLDELKPEGNEVVFNKTRNSAFWGTDFEKTLADRRINQIILAGVGTNVCVESTARDAFTNGIYTVTVRDATATQSAELQNASMETLEWFGGTATAEEVMDALKGLT